MPAIKVRLKCSLTLIVFSCFSLPIADERMWAENVKPSANVAPSKNIAKRLPEMFERY